VTVEAFTPVEIAAAEHVLRNALRTDFCAFVEKSFATVCPDQTFQPNWHLEAIAHALERVVAGDTKRLIILMPPRNLKSICASVALPAWLLGRDPTRQIICVSYSAELAAKHARDCRAVMMAPWFQNAFPSSRIDPGKSAEAEFMTTQRGVRLATSIGGTLTGRGGDILIIDDPMKPADAQSETRRLDCQQWFTNTLLSRLDDKVNGAIVVVMQRLHLDDLAGYLLAQEGWEVLSLPAIADVEQIVPIGSDKAHHRRVGEILHPEREPREVLEQLRKDMGSYNFSAQYQQAPVPVGGNMIHWEWFGFCSDPLPRPESAIIVQSWDTASTTSDLASYSVGITAQVDRNGTIHVLDVVRGRWQFPDLVREIRKAAECHRPKSILIEDQASGTGVQQSLKRDGFPVVPIKPKGDKAMRMHGHTPTVEAGKVLLKKDAPWLDDFRSEVLAFPHGKHDDQIDALSQLMTWAEDWRIPKHRIGTFRWAS
jgi:predicted phage terminase large subunit-like protein